MTKNMIYSNKYNPVYLLFYTIYHFHDSFDCRLIIYSHQIYFWAHFFFHIREKREKWAKTSKLEIGVFSYFLDWVALTSFSIYKIYKENLKRKTKDILFNYIYMA